MLPTTPRATLPRLAMRLTTLAALAAALALSTALGGWWTVPLACGAWGMARRARRGHAVDAGVAAALGWAALLAVVAMRGPVAAVATQLGDVTGAPAPALLLLTLVFPFALGWSAARLGGAVGRLVRPVSRTAAAESDEAGRGVSSPARLEPNDDGTVSARS